MSTDSPALRQQRRRDRLAGRLPPVERLTCSDCGKSHTGAHGSHCSRCWLRTDAGREWQRLRLKSYRARVRRRNEA